MNTNTVHEVSLPSASPAAAINQLVSSATGDYLLVSVAGSEITPGARAVERLIQTAGDSGAAIVYSDFRERGLDGTITDHPLIDYQPGAIRDNFDFGSLFLISVPAARDALARYGSVPAELKFGGFYDLRLKLSTSHPIVRLPEPLYTRSVVDGRVSGERIFDYVDPRNRDYQIEMEKIATEHLRRVGGLLDPVFSPVPPSETEFKVKASVIIPVRNRVKTVADAVHSVLSQKADFDFNIIVIDNHSTDGTTELLKQLASGDARVIHLVPKRTDYGIGGCWNEGVFSPSCGHYAVQLDSDDIYSDKNTLATMVAAFENGRYAMVIGSYTTVDFDLNELPPGLIDHREWTRENGRNNALRINGLGAPRAFDVSVLRQYGLPDVSYGEDYAVALRLSREFEIGRVYHSVYYARRWSGNSDSALPLATMNRYDFYKDRIRTLELEARRRRNLNG